MDEIEKLFRKISKKDRTELLGIIDILHTHPNSLSKHIQKVIGTEFYKIRQGRYRIIFHYSTGEIIIDSIKLRNEKTYKNL